MAASSAALPLFSSLPWVAFYFSPPQLILGFYPPYLIEVVEIITF
jgi:hypothetical protein